MECGVMKTGGYNPARVELQAVVIFNPYRVAIETKPVTLPISSGAIHIESLRDLSNATKYN